MAEQIIASAVYPWCETTVCVVEIDEDGSGSSQPRPNEAMSLLMEYGDKMAEALTAATGEEA